MDNFKEVIILLFFGWLFLATMLLRGVFFMLKRYWYVWTALAVFAVVFYDLNPNLGNKPVIIEPPMAVQPTCHFYEGALSLNEHMLDLEVCVGENTESYTLYYGKQPLVIELYLDGKMIRQEYDYDLLRFITKEKEQPIQTSLQEMLRYDI